MAKIHDDFARFMDEFKLVHPGSYSGNAARYTAEYVAAMNYHGALEGLEVLKVRVATALLELEPGLLMRTPRNEFGQDSIDNAQSMMYIDFILDTGFAKRWLEYNRTKPATSLDKEDPKPQNKWVYRLLSLFGLLPIKFVQNNMRTQTFNVSAFMGRFQQVIACAQVVSGEKPGFFRCLWSAVTLYLGAKEIRKGHQDPVILGYFLREIMSPYSKMVKWVAEKYWNPALEEIHDDNGLAGGLTHVDEHAARVWMKGMK